MTAASLLVELFTEELPPKALSRLSESFAEALATVLRQRGYLAATSAMTPYATPRRLAVSISEVSAVAPDAEVVDKLMPVKVARDAAGQPSEALRKKLNSLGRGHLATASLDATDGPDRVYVQSDGKADYVYLQSLARGQPLQHGLQEALDAALAALPIPKLMSYAGPGAYFNNQKFVRPAHRLLALHGAAVVPVAALGLSAGRVTGGHRFLSRGELEIASAGAWAPTLEAEGKVQPSFAARRAAIAVAIEGAAGDATAIAPDALLDEVTALVEWPAVYAGTFDPAFLDVPQECLILTMQLNQKYFALADDAGKLVNRFLMVSNITTSDPSAIISGNERVLRARLADAKFFFDQDRRVRLDSRVDKLKSIVYHNKLGTQAERVDRISLIAGKLAPLLGADKAAAERAARLAKADLTTDMVGEFPELQGTMGRTYALHDGEAATIAAAIEQHYWPKVAGGALPESTVAQAVALADKLESLAGLFGIGQIPTGDKDPFGLRRATLGVIRILIERGHAIPLSTLVAIAQQAFDQLPAVTRDPAPLLDFIHDRLRGVLRDQGYSALEVAAVVNARPDAIADLPARLAAVQAFGTLPEAAALAAANKRIVNILKKSGAEAAGTIDRSLLTAGAEQDLQGVFQALGPTVAAACAKGDYSAALKALATAKPAVDRFFDEVMVMDDNPVVRANRLALLREVAVTMNRVADISALA